MARKKKFRPGKTLNILGLIEELNGERYVYLRDTPKHPDVMCNMSLRTLWMFCLGGSIREAILNEEE